MKEQGYFQRVFSNVKKWQLVYWWIFRVVMIVAMFRPSPTSEIDPKQNMAQMGANLAAMFLWEIFMLFPEKTFVRHLPSAIQNITIPFIILGAFGGAYLGFYYSIWWWDAALHTLGSFIGVLLCYEILTAIQKRDRQKMNLSIILIAAVGLCFMFGVIWELFEFTCDQILPNSDTQHWDVTKFHEGYRNLFPPRYEARTPLMDTMSDTVCNVVGAVLGFIALKIKPYRHSGKNDINKLIELEEAEEKKAKSQASV